MRYTRKVALSPTTYRFTVKDYHRMATADVFEPDDRVELLDGRVYEMAPIGSWHAACVKRLTSSFVSGLGGRAIVSVQDPIWLDDHGEPQPDVALLRPRADFYQDGHAGPGDVLLIVEVAETTLAYDLEQKAPRYLAAGISEVWVVDVVRRVVHVMTAGDTRTVAAGASVAAHAFPDLVLDVAMIVGSVS
jgi:Uma2 family endonuclease